MNGIDIDRAHDRYEVPAFLPVALGKVYSQVEMDALTAENERLRSVIERQDAGREAAQHPRAGTPEQALTAQGPAARRRCAGAGPARSVQAPWWSGQTECGSQFVCALHVAEALRERGGVVVVEQVPAFDQPALQAHIAVLPGQRLTCGIERHRVAAVFPGQRAQLAVDVRVGEVGVVGGQGAEGAAELLIGHRGFLVRGSDRQAGGGIRQALVGDEITARFVAGEHRGGDCAGFLGRRRIDDLADVGRLAVVAVAAGGDDAGGGAHGVSPARVSRYAEPMSSNVRDIGALCKQSENDHMEQSDIDAWRKHQAVVKAAQDELAVLKPAERQALTYIAKGMSNAEIAALMNRSPQMTERYAAQMRHALGMTTFEAVTLAIRAGWV